ncbi:myoneurin isoform X2 [Topomyia yanbarensis]|uniref:myoneurin isoform X2 n=1 Tax=Topomyia yanbarensis TaxID=2498891 RepID=UPI00273B2D29|nr:myoneurin isoform X2 [Topomyia yanbarensis]
MEFDPSSYHCAICMFREHPFETLSVGTIAGVIGRGRPTPALPLLSKECRYKGKVFTRRFKKDNYLRYEWLAGCEIENKLFCWPCYIFSSDPTDTWGYKGFDGLSNFSNSVKTHLNQEMHLLNAEKYNCYASEGRKILSESPRGQQFASSIQTGRRKMDLGPIITVASRYHETEDDDDEAEMIHHSDVLVEVLGDEGIQEANSSARETVDMSQSSAGAEKYQLKWHSHQQNLNSSISCLYKNDRYADVMLITCNNEESFSMAAHKLVLGTSSTYFANIFEKYIVPPNAMTYIVLPPELTRRALQTLIQYMYTGESTVSVDILNEVLRGGEILKIRGLWRNPGASDGTASTEQTASKGIHGRHRTERISVDRIPLQEPRVAQNPVTVHDSPVIVTNPSKSYGISQTAQMPASSSTPIINVKKDVAIDPGERVRPVSSYDAYPSSTKRTHPTTNQENTHQIPRQQSTPKNSPSRAVLSNAENVPTTPSVSQTMPEELNFLNVKEEPVEWSDVNAGEIDLDKSGLPIVKVEMKDPTCSDGSEDQSQEQVYSPLTCELCSETFTVPAEWVRHIESHTDPPHTVSKRRRRLENDNTTDVTAALKCDLCAMYFVTPAEWVRHVQSTHTETELAISNNSTLPRRGAKSSIIDSRHSTVPVSIPQTQERTCSVCNKGFPSYASMIIHKRTHTGERPFYCEICHKGFNVKSNLLRHMRTLHNQQDSQSPTQCDPESHSSSDD